MKILAQLIRQLTVSPINYKLVGNIPYYITGKLLRIVGESEPKPTRSVLTVQKEVAERLSAKPPKMNRLAASVQFWAEPEIIAVLSKNEFRPKPKVDSAVVRLESRIQNLESRKVTPDKYYQAVRILFQQPRKTIMNNLLAAGKTDKRGFFAQELQKIGIDPNARPQNLSIEQILNISPFV